MTASMAVLSGRFPSFNFNWKVLVHRLAIGQPWVYCEIPGAILDTYRKIFKYLLLSERIVIGSNDLKINFLSGSALQQVPMEFH